MMETTLEERSDAGRSQRLHPEVDEMLSLLEQAVPGGVGQTEWPRWRARAVGVVERVNGPDWLQQHLAAPREPTGQTDAPAPSRRVTADAEVLRRVEANMAWLLRTARPHCGSEPESYDLADAVAAHADLQRLLSDLTTESA